MRNIHYITESLKEDVADKLITTTEAANILEQVYEKNITEALNQYLWVIEAASSTKIGKKAISQIVRNKQEQLEKLKEELKTTSGEAHEKVQAEMDKISNELKALDAPTKKETEDEEDNA